MLKENLKEDKNQSNEEGNPAPPSLLKFDGIKKKMLKKKKILKISQITMKYPYKIKYQRKLGQLEAFSGRKD
jgi:hypothetical protein